MDAQKIRDLIAGNNIGAWMGMDGMPEDWIAQLEPAEEIEAVADGMKRVIEVWGAPV